MQTPSVNSDVIKHFVREQLGCGCPDEVFSTIRVSYNPDVFDDKLVDYLLQIGGRLLVAVSTQDWQKLNQQLEPVFQAGKAYRDAHGFNRFRLVVATTNKGAPASMMATFNALKVTDEKTHLHVIDPADLPADMSI